MGGAKVALKRHSGYAPFPRKWMDHPLLSKRPGFAAFLLHCCYRARFKPGWVHYRGERVYLEVGQFLFGRRRWVRETGRDQGYLQSPGAYSQKCHCPGV